MRLNLGAGEDIKTDAINIDFVSLPGIDLVWDITKPLPYPPNSIEKIYAQHIIEHLLSNVKDVGDRQNFVKNIIEGWYKLLQPEGELKIFIPDIILSVRMYLDGFWSYEEVIGSLYGVAGSPRLRHNFGFSFERLKEVLLAIGFKKVERLDKKGDYDNVRHYSKEELQKHYSEPNLSGHVALKAIK